MYVEQGAQGRGHPRQGEPLEQSTESPGACGARLERKGRYCRANNDVDPCWQGESSGDGELSELWAGTGITENYQFASH